MHDSTSFFLFLVYHLPSSILVSLCVLVHFLIFSVHLSQVTVRLWFVLQLRRRNECATVHAVWMSGKLLWDVAVVTLRCRRHRQGTAFHNHTLHARTRSSRLSLAASTQLVLFCVCLQSRSNEFAYLWTPNALPWDSNSKRSFTRTSHADQAHAAWRPTRGKLAQFTCDTRHTAQYGVQFRQREVTTSGHVTG